MDDEDLDIDEDIDDEDMDDWILCLITLIGTVKFK
jgi:hypothetical protein